MAGSSWSLRVLTLSTTWSMIRMERNLLTKEEKASSAATGSPELASINADPIWASRSAGSSGLAM